LQLFSSILISTAAVVHPTESQDFRLQPFICVWPLTTVYTIEDVKLQYFLFPHCSIGIGF